MTVITMAPDAEADAATASAVLSDIYGLHVPAALIRVWGSRGLITPTRVDPSIGRRGAQLYTMTSILERARRSASRR